MSKRLLIVLESLTLCTLLSIGTVSAQEVEVEVPPSDEIFQSNPLGENYVLHLEVNLKDSQKKMSFVVASNKFSVIQYFSGISLNVKFQGRVEKEEKGGFVVNYTLELREQVKGGDEDIWIGNESTNSVILMLGEEVTVFQVEDRSYKLKLKKLSEK